MSRPAPRQLAQDGATDGQVLSWDNAAGEWQPSAGGGGAGTTVHSETISAWTADSGLFRADVSHNLGTKDVIVHGYLTSNDLSVGFEDIDRTDVNTVRIWVAVEENVRIVVASDGGASSAVPSSSFDADQLLSPNNADWAVNALAPLAADSNNAALGVRLFDDTTEEGVGLVLDVPATASNLKIKFKSRAETAPAGVRTVGVKLYTRNIPDDGAVGAWSAGTVLADIDIPVSELWQYDEETITLATLGITAGNLTQLELTRINPLAGTELVGDWAMAHVGIEFS